MAYPTGDELEFGVRAFQAHEARDAMYKVATFLVDDWWGNPSEMADGMGVLLLTWNQAFYRYGVFDFAELEACIERNIPSLQCFRGREVTTYSALDDDEIVRLFGEFLDALRIRDKRPDGPSSPVASSKALHLMAPGYFPLWDQAIAKAYRCDYSSRPAQKYVVFLSLMKELVPRIKPALLAEQKPKSALKLIDEYNYARFTKKWL